jgi:hypothetical protein
VDAAEAGRANYSAYLTTVSRRCILAETSAAAEAETRRTVMRQKLILLSLAALAATALVGALASASASAITPVFLVCLEKAGSGKKFEDRNCSKESGLGKFELVEVTEFLKANGTGGVAKLATKLAGAELVITCKKATGTGEFGPKGLSRGEVSYEECALGNSKEEFVSCEVPNIKFKIIDQLVENAKGEVEDEIKPEKGNLLVEIELKNKGSKTCAEKGKFTVEGTQNVEVEQPATGAKLLREVVFKPSGSHLKFDHEVATSEGKVSIDLDNDDSWGVSIP